MIAKITRHIGFVLLFLLGFGAYTYGSTFEPVYTADKEARCELAKTLYRKARDNKTLRYDEIAQLKKFAIESNDDCLQLASLVFMAGFMDQSSSAQEKDEEEILRLYKEALFFAAGKGFEEEDADLTYRVGMKYYHMKSFPQAFEYLLESYEKFKTLGFDRFPKMQLYLYNIGKVYYEFGDFNTALVYLRQSIRYPFDNDRAAIHDYNILGLTYNMLGDGDTAIYYYKKGMAVATASKDSVWIGILGGNMANIFLKMGDLASAKPLIYLDYSLSTQYGETSSAANCLLLLADINMQEDSLSAAVRRVHEVETSHLVDAGKSLKKTYFRTRAKLSFLQQDFKNAYLFLDSFILYKDLISAENDQNLLRNTEIKVQTERYLSEIQLLELEKERAQIARNFILSASALFIIIIFLIFYTQRQKRRRKNELLLVEKRRAEEELQNAENALQWYMNNLLEKNRLIDNFKDEIELLKKQSEVISPENEKIMEKLYEATILTEEDWTNFKRMFEKVHGDFFVRLKNKYPDLTLAEIRLIALTKLNLSTNEIANMLGISPDSVRKTGSRMRKKLNLTSQSEISDIASHI